MSPKRELIYFFFPFFSYCKMHSLLLWIKYEEEDVYPSFKDASQDASLIFLDFCGKMFYQ